MRGRRGARDCAATRSEPLRNLEMAHMDTDTRRETHPCVTISFGPYLPRFQMMSDPFQGFLQRLTYKKTHNKVTSLDYCVAHSIYTQMHFISCSCVFLNVLNFERKMCSKGFHRSRFLLIFSCILLSKCFNAQKLFFSYI